MIQVRYPEEHSLENAQLAEYLKARIAVGKSLRKLQLSHVMGAFAHLYARLGTPLHELYSKYRPLGLAHFLSFIHPDSIATALRSSLRDRHALDKVIELDCGCLVRAEPRGVAVHWLAGNTPLLALLSVVQALVTKNISIVKVSSKQPDYISPILRELAFVPGGKTLADAVTVLSFNRDNRAANETLSQLADVRIAWGGEEAVAAVQGLPKSLETVDVIFGPKYSVAIVDPERNVDLNGLARDVLMFKQLACSSPHVCYVRGTPDTARQYARALADALELQQHMPLETAEAMRVLTYRTEQAMDGDELLVSEGTGWTVGVGQTPDPAVGYGVLQVIAFQEFAEIMGHLPRTIQTISHNLGTEDVNALLNVCGDAGVPVCRLPLLGRAHHYHVPWDGVWVHDHLVRWIDVEVEG